MARRLHQTMADYVVIAISPALIMTLVGSLVFFLLAVLYQGEFAARLHWVMALFVFAAVLIGRISIEEGFERAAPFGIALATVVGLAATKFMEVQGTWVDSFAWLINGGLIALIWWCAHRLTWDCTLVDDSQDASGVGLMQTAGLERSAATDSPVEEVLEGTTSRAAKAGWWQRFVEHQHRPHAPGVWVVYFSLAALPLFGIGQWFIPAANIGGRRYAFWLLCVYVASGMGLLLTTSFLGLRRYLRQRRIEMPTLMANLWLGTGAAIIGTLLLLAAMLPRPSAEYPISQLPFTVGSPAPKASNSAAVPQEGTRDEEPGSAPDRQPPGDDQDSGEEPSARAGDKSSATSSAGKPGQQGAQGEGGDRKSAASKGDESKDQPAPSGESQVAQDQAGKKQANPSQANPSQTTQDQATQDQATQDRIAKAMEKVRENLGQKPQPPAVENPPPQPQPTSAKADAAQQPATPPDKPPTPGPTESPPEPTMLENLKTATQIGEWFKLLFNCIFALAVLYGFWRSRAEILAALRAILASLREMLFGRKRVRKAGAGDPTAVPEFPPTPFSSYADPFATGSAANYSSLELVRYSFEAFEAWAREHGCPRHSDQTPHELARDVGRLNAAMAGDARNLAELYARAAYARGDVPETAREQLRQLWQRMRSVSSSPFSPGR